MTQPRKSMAQTPSLDPHEVKAIWEAARAKFHYPPLEEPTLVTGLEGGAAYDFRRRQTIVDDAFIADLHKKTGLPIGDCLEGVLVHEIGHYMVAPRNLATLILAAKMVDDFFGRSDGNPRTCRDEEERAAILQTYLDMANDTASMLDESKTGSILNIRCAMQATYTDELNHHVRAVMLAYLHWQAQKPYSLEPAELSEFFDRMKQIDFLNLDTNKMRQGIWAFGNLIIDMIDKYAQSGGNTGNKAGSNAKGGSGQKYKLVLDHDDCSIPKNLKEATREDLDEALRNLTIRVSRREFKKLVQWLQDHGVSSHSHSSSPNYGIGTSEGELRIDPEVVKYYAALSTHYPLIVTKRQMPTTATLRSWSDTKRWQPQDDPMLALPHTSGGTILPGVTRSVRIIPRPIKSRDYDLPHLLVVIDSSGSMGDPKDHLSHAVLGGFCAARSYHLHRSHIGVINFSGQSFYLSYTRNLDDALGGIAAYQGGGTVLDVELLKSMLGPEFSRLYTENPELALKQASPLERMRAERKQISLSMSAIERAFDAGYIDLFMFTDGGIVNLPVVLEFLASRRELNRATLVLTNSYNSALVESPDPRIRIVVVDEPKDIPHLVGRETKRNLNSLAEARFS